MNKPYTPEEWQTLTLQEQRIIKSKILNFPKFSYLIAKVECRFEYTQDEWDGMSSSQRYYIKNKIIERPELTYLLEGIDWNLDRRTGEHYENRVIVNTVELIDRRGARIMGSKTLSRADAILEFPTHEERYKELTPFVVDEEQTLYGCADVFKFHTTYKSKNVSYRHFIATIRKHVTELKLNNEEYDVIAIELYFFNSNTNQMFVRSMTKPFLNEGEVFNREECLRYLEEEQFDNTFINIETQYRGSDAILNPEAALLDPTRFDITVFKVSRGGMNVTSRACSIYWCLGKAQSYPSPDSNCLLRCLKYALRLPGTINSLMNEHNLPTGPISLEQIPIFEDTFNCIITVWVDEKQFIILEGEQIMASTRGYCKFTGKISSLPIIWNSARKEGKKVDMLFKDRHYLLITSLNLKQCSHCGYPNCKNIEMCRKNLSLKSIPKKETSPIKDVYFDIETVHTNHVLDPYLTAMMIEEKVVCSRLGTKESATAYLKQMIQSDKKLRLIAYNGAGFDFFFFYRYLFEARIILPPKNLLFSQNRILQLKYNKLRVWDPYQHLHQSLEAACAGFSIRMKKDDIDHKLIQTCHELSYEDGKKINIKGTETSLWEEMWKAMGDKISEYNIQDVRMLKEVVEAYVKACTTLGLPDPRKFPTVAGMVYSMWRKKNTEYVKACPTLELDKCVRKSFIGGRTELPLGPCHYFSKGDTKLYRLYDCVSLYPYVMMSQEYPTGIPFEVKGERADLLGIYLCKVREGNTITGSKKLIPNKLHLNILPLRSKNKGLEWGTRVPQEVWITTIDMTMIRVTGGTVDVIKGICWPTKANLFKDFLEPFKQEKIRQDKLDKEKDPLYNKALRSVCKLMMNSLSGKMLQRNFMNDWTHVSTEEELLNFLKTRKYKSFSHVVDSIFKVEADKIKYYDPKRAKPSQIGAFIYSYARAHMFVNGWSKVSWNLCDTDSFNTEEAIQTGTDFGQFMCDYISVEGYVIAKKCYWLRGVNPLNPFRARFKGLSGKESWVSSSGVTGVGLVRDLYKELFEGNTVIATCWKIQRDLKGGGILRDITYTKTLKLDPLSLELSEAEEAMFN